MVNNSHKKKPIYLSPQIIEHKKTTYAIGNLGPGLGQAQKCDRVKLVNWILTLFLLMIWSTTSIYRFILYIILNVLP